MTFHPKDIQARLLALGYSPGPVDGILGQKTHDALTKAVKDLGVATTSDLFHTSGLHRIILHWTAGAAGLIQMELNSYNLLIGQDCRPYWGTNKPEANASTADGQYAAHTWKLNTGSIGVALDAMADAQERPFDPGSAPITEGQLKVMAQEVARLCKTYWIPVTKWSVLTHAEVEPTLGVKQKNKWDITWLPGMDAPGDPLEVGRKLRLMILKEMGDGSEELKEEPPAAEQTLSADALWARILEVGEQAFGKPQGEVK